MPVEYLKKFTERQCMKYFLLSLSNNYFIVLKKQLVKDLLIHMQVDSSNNGQFVFDYSKIKINIISNLKINNHEATIDPWFSDHWVNIFILKNLY